MRRSELMAGGILLVLGLFAPVPNPGEIVVSGEGVQGELWFETAEWMGTAQVEAIEAALVVHGPVHARGAGTTATVVVYTYEYVRSYLDVPMYATRTSFYPEDMVKRLDLTEARIEVMGLADGLFYAWPNATGQGAAFELTLAAPHNSSIFASAHTAWFVSDDGRHDHLLEAPVFGVGQGLSTYQSAQLGSARFQGLRAGGDLQFVVENSDLVIEHGQGREVFALRKEPTERANGLPVLDHGHVSYAVITVPAGRFDVGFDGSKAAFLSRNPTWNVEGTLTMEVHEGRVWSSSGARDIDGGRLRMAGNATLGLSAEGTPERRSETHQDIGAIRVGPIGPEPPEPEVRGVFHADEGTVTINGRSMAPLPAANARPFLEEVNLVAKALGALMLVWAAARGVMIILVGRAVKDPLANRRRRAVHEFLAGAGHAHLSDIQRATRVPLGSLAYHMGVLRRAGVVARVSSAGYSVYSVRSPDFSGEDMRRLALLAHPTRRRLCEALAQAGPLSQLELAGRLGISQPSVSKQMATLLRDRLVERNGTRPATYNAGALLRRWFAFVNRPRFGPGPARLRVDRPDVAAVGSTP